MLVQILLPIKAFSVNRYTYRDKNFKSRDACDWETQVCALLNEHKALYELADDWKKHGGSFRVSMTFVYPHHVFYNKAGAISAKAFDLSNVEKPLLDMLFRETMGVDDRFVTELVSRKRAGGMYAIEVELELNSDSSHNRAVSGV